MFYTTGQRKLWQRILFAVLPVLSIGLIILFYAVMQQKMPLVIPSASGLLERLVQTFTQPVKNVNLLGHIAASLRRVLIALAAAWVLGISFGVLIGWNRTCKALFGSIFEIFRPIPPIAWIPIVIMWFGISELPKVIIVFIGSFVPVVINTEAGIRMVEKEYIQVGRVFGANRWQLLSEFVVPTALPSIFAGVRTSVSSAWMLVLAAEMLGADLGVGALVTRGWNAGGMKQRVGIARAYAANPSVLIMDEPFGQLDAQTRYSMQNEILRIWEAEKRTVIFVTNNIEEACYLGDRIILLSDCPASVKEIYPIDLPRPRNMVSRAFLDVRTQISENTDLSI